MYSYTQLTNILVSIFEKMGCSSTDARISASVLVKAELRGIPSHGVLRGLEIFRVWEAGRINTKPNIKIIHETPSTATIDGDSGIGMVVGQKAMSIAIEKAKTAGSAWIAVRNSNNYGIAGYYSMMALEHDMIGLSMTSASPLVAPTYSADRLLGTNPISVAIPAGEQPPFVADFATTPITRGKLTIYSKEGKKVDKGYVQDKEGISSNNPAVLEDGGAILPLGGDYEHGGHKGYCLGSIVDMLSGVLGGANFGPLVPPMVAYLPVLQQTVGVGLGHFFGAMRVDAFRPLDEFKKSMDEWIGIFRNSKPVVGQKEVLIPGDPERRSEEEKMQNGIELLPAIEKELNQVLEKLGLA
ncbi:MAG: Ldh family oxidoreductase [Prevotellaceae bacterium]|nr:Ldh family oxidoreductase [Prevotellaceae bacterium]